MKRFPRLLAIVALSIGGLLAPAAVHAAPDSDGGHVVKDGDSLSGIARRQGVTIDDLLAANGLTLTSVIHPGQRLVIPGGASAASTVATTAPVASSGTYTVRSGDSLYGIARRQGVALRDLLAANGLTLTSVILPGQRLVIPGGASAAGAVATTAPVASSGTYTVRSGDSLYGIARQQGVVLGDLLGANGLTLTSVIHPGQRLVIPAASAAGTQPSAAAAPTTSTAAGTYTVQSGDSLSGIARRHGVAVRDLLAANGLTLSSVIHPGQQLRLPAAATGTTPAPTTTPTTAVPPTAAGAPPTTASAAAVERIIRDVWPDNLEEMALWIAWRESGFVPHAQNQCCSGLFQIYYDVHKVWLAGLGIDSRDDLYDPRTNAVAALALYQRAGGWAPWSLPAD